MADSYSADDVRALWEETRSAFATSRRRIALVRRWLQNSVEPTIPDDFPVASSLRVKLPLPITTASHTVQLLSRKRPTYRRTPLGEGLAPRKTSTKIELWSNGLPGELEAQGGALWRPLVENLLLLGECALLLYPQTAHWEQFPAWSGEDGEPLPAYQRDRQGRAPDDAYYAESRRRTFKTDYQRSQSAYTAYLADWKAQRLPFVGRVVGPDQCLPILGPNHRLDGLLVYSEFTEYQLHRRGYRWLGGDRLVGPGQSTEGTGLGLASMQRLAGLYELWLPGKVVYCVGQRATALPGEDPSDAGSLHAGDLWQTFKLNEDGQAAPAEVDLEETYGFDQLPAWYGYGAHFASEPNPDLRGLPFLWPFLESFHAANSFATAKVLNAWNRAFGQEFVEIDSNLAESHPELILEDGRPRKIPKEPNIATYVGGRVVKGYDQSAGNDVDEIVGLLLGTLKEDLPSPTSFGGGTAASGHDRSLIRSFLEDAYNDTLEGARQGWEWLGETALEWGTRLAETQGHAVAVYVTRSGEGERREHVELGADLCQGTFSLEAYYPGAPGENLPYAQMLMEWSIQKRVPLRYALEQGLGVENPEDLLVEIEVEDLLQTPQGKSLLLNYAAQEAQDSALAELEKAFALGAMARDGTPTAAMAGVPGAGGPGQGVPGAAPPGQGALTGTALAANPVRSAVGGMVQGATEAGARMQDLRAALQAGARRPGV